MNHFPTPKGSLIPISFAAVGFIFTVYIEKKNEMEFRDLLDENFDSFRELIDHIDISTEESRDIDIDDEIPY